MTLDRRGIRYRRGLRSYSYLELAATACRRLRLPYTRRCRRWRRPDREGVASRSRLALSLPPRHRAEWQLLQVTSRAPWLDTSEEYGMRHHATWVISTTSVRASSASRSKIWTPPSADTVNVGPAAQTDVGIGKATSEKANVTANPIIVVAISEASLRRGGNIL